MQEWRSPLCTLCMVLRSAGHITTTVALSSAVQEAKESPGSADFFVRNPPHHTLKNVSEGSITTITRAPPAFPKEGVEVGGESGPRPKCGLRWNAVWESGTAPCLSFI
jgi:hypothetical protein